MLRFSLGTAAVAVLLAACLSAESETSQGEQASTASDWGDARANVDLLEQRCSSCHDITAAQIRTWASAMKSVDTDCIKKPGLSPGQRVDCLRDTPGDETTAFEAERLGFYATAASLDVMKNLFADAAGEAGVSEQTYTDFVHSVHMPRSGQPLTAEEFDRLKSWVLRGMPLLDRAANPEAGPPITQCTPKSTPELAAHIAAMKTGGWGARLADQATPMMGCKTATQAVDCLTDFADATSSVGAPAVPQMLRQLREQTLASRYWVRSSPDGRWFGYGFMSAAKIVDLSKPATEIKVAAPYDPNFMASNDGFAFAGTKAGGFRVCRMSLLLDAAKTPTPTIGLDEAKCTQVGDDVYQSIGSALDGSRYFVTWGNHENDDGGNSIKKPLPASYGDGSTTKLTPMVTDGLAYRADSTVTIGLPGEGDMMLSPSSLVSATRFGADGKNLGYRVRFLKTTGSGPSLSVQTPLAAEICVPGGKAMFSFDERFMAMHQYVDPDSPNGLPVGSSNIVVVDLMTSKAVRITEMKAGQFALYPHFRADGWLYFLVRDMNTKKEQLIASDVAVRLAAP